MQRLHTFTDRLIGLTDMGPGSVRKVRALQLRSVIDSSPAASFGALAAVILMCTIMWETPYAKFTLAIGSAVLAFQALSVWRFFEFRRNGYPQEVSVRTLSKVAISAGLFGALWGSMAYLLLVYADSSWLFLVGMLIGGILMVCVYCFHTVFPAVMSFVAVSGSILGVAFASRPEYVGATSAILFLGLYFLVIPRIAFAQMKDFVSHCSAELRNANDAMINDALLKQFEEAGDEWFWATGADGQFTRLSDGLCEILGIAQSSLSKPVDLQTIGDSDGGTVALKTAFDTQEDFNDIRLTVPNGEEVRWLSFSGRRSVDGDGEFVGMVGVCADVTKERLAEEKIVEMAMIDGLTGIQNRTYFYQTLDAHVRRLERYGSSFSLLFLDLDKFKLVNDTYGHHAGDALLKEAAARIQSALREVDVVGRLGGDEFAIIVEDTSDPVFIAKLASRIISEVAAPYYVANETLYIGVSVGVALAPVHGTQSEQLLRNADLALYRAKADGRGVFRYFEAQMDFEQRERRILEQEMREALSNDEFEMKFQPMISTSSGEVVCMEALIRWNHEIRGLLAPDEFISIAEQSNLIVEVGRWSLLSACQTALTWPENVNVAVNVSALHFMRSDIVEDVSQILAETGLSASRLELEITESVLIHDDMETFTKLNGLRAIGVTIAMDDFGTGYSSLGYLTKFRFDRLKIDRSFLIDMDKDENRKAIVYTISTLGQNLGIDITVEGVETAEHAEFLKSIHCDQAQGYYYSRPISKEEVPAFLLRRFQNSIDGDIAETLEDKSQKIQKKSA